jgi:hypothetical protein
MEIQAAHSRLVCSRIIGVMRIVYVLEGKTRNKLAGLNGIRHRFRADLIKFNTG